MGWENGENGGKKFFSPPRAVFWGWSCALTQLNSKFPSFPRRKFQRMSSKSAFPPELHQPFSPRPPVVPSRAHSPALCPLPLLPGDPGLNSRRSPRHPNALVGITRGRASGAGSGVSPSRGNPTAPGAAPPASTGLERPGGSHRDPLRVSAGGAALPGCRADGAIRLCPDVLARPRPLQLFWTPLASCARPRDDAPSSCK